MITRSCLCQILFDDNSNPVSATFTNSSSSFEVKGEQQYCLYAACFDKNGLYDFLEIKRSDNEKELEEFKHAIEYFLKVVSFQADFTSKNEQDALCVIPDAYRITGYGITFVIEPV